MHLSAFAKANLVLGWVYIDINKLWINRQMQNKRRVPTVVHDVLITLLYSMYD